jgi:hypothetical protein
LLIGHGQDRDGQSLISRLNFPYSSILFLWWSSRDLDYSWKARGRKNERRVRACQFDMVEMWFAPWYSWFDSTLSETLLRLLSFLFCAFHIALWNVRRWSWTFPLIFPTAVGRCLGRYLGWLLIETDCIRVSF